MNRTKRWSIIYLSMISALIVSGSLIGYELATRPNACVYYNHNTSLLICRKPLTKTYLICHNAKTLFPACTNQSVLDPFNTVLPANLILPANFSELP